MFHTRVRQEGALKADNSHPTQGPSWGYVKVICEEMLSTFGKHIPTKWLQERAKGSKNEHGMPPRRASSGVHFVAYIHTSFILQIEYVPFNLFCYFGRSYVVHTSFYTICYFGEPQGTFLEVPRPGFGSFILDLVSFFKDRHRVASWVFMTNLL